MQTIARVWRGGPYHGRVSDRPTMPFGSWPSRISVEMAVGASRGLSEPRQDGDAVFVLESRPEEAGRVALLPAAAGTARSWTWLRG